MLFRIILKRACCFGLNREHFQPHNRFSRGEHFASSANSEIDCLLRCAKCSCLFALNPSFIVLYLYVSDTTPFQYTYNVSGMWRPCEKGRRLGRRRHRFHHHCCVRVCVYLDVVLVVYIECRYCTYTRNNAINNV